MCTARNFLNNNNLLSWLEYADEDQAKNYLLSRLEGRIKSKNQIVRGARGLYRCKLADLHPESQGFVFFSGGHTGGALKGNGFCLYRGNGISPNGSDPRVKKDRPACKTTSKEKKEKRA